jgi:hypothetical protein
MLETISEWFYKPAGQAFVQKVERDQKGRVTGAASGMGQRDTNCK